MKVGVTGASGMLGSALITHLSKSYRVFATSQGKGVEGKNIKWDFIIYNKKLNEIYNEKILMDRSFTLYEKQSENKDYCPPSDQ